jgi:hypothetical protein
MTTAAQRYFIAPLCLDSTHLCESESRDVESESYLWSQAFSGYRVTISTKASTKRSGEKD